MERPCELDVLGIGAATLDTIGIVDEFAAPDTKVRVHAVERHGGGTAATAMVACRRLGLRPGLIAKIGDDAEGREIVRGLEAEGVDVSQMVTGAGQRSTGSFCFANRKTSQRVIYHYRSQLPFLAFTQIDQSLLKRVPILLVDTAELPAAAKAAEVARGAGGMTVMDGDSVRAGSDEALPHIDYLVASWEFARGQTMADAPQRALEALRWSGHHRAVVITLGAEGYVGAEGGRASFRGEAFRVKAVDTTGAGDVFHGAFCVGLSRRWPLEQACVFAAACAAIKCRRLGGRQGIPTWDEAIAFCRENARWHDWPE